MANNSINLEKIELAVRVDFPSRIHLMKNQSKLFITGGMLLAFTFSTLIFSSLLYTENGAQIQQDDQWTAQIEENNYSSYNCKLVELGNENTGHLSCVFDNVSINNGTLYYYKEPNVELCKDQSKPCPFANYKIGLRTSHNPTNRDSLNIEVINDLLPENTTFQKENISYYLSSDGKDDLKSWLIEDLFAMFCNVLEFAIDISEIQLFATRKCTKSPGLCEINNRYWVDNLNYLLNNKPIILDSKSPQIFFRKLVVGQSQYSSYYEPSKLSQSWTKFRNLMWLRLSTNKLLIPKKPVLGIFNPRFSSLTNLASVVEKFQFKYDVRVVDNVLIPFEELVKFTYIADILITPSGPSCYSLGFMRDDQTAIVLDTWDIQQDKSISADFDWWHSLGVTKVSRYEIEQKEITEYPSLDKYELNLMKIEKILQPV